ncbi:MAG: exopolysaccharide biosynthesis polyprenyl glycosylphosphotransferase, partial [Blautia sp.]|nr:exopolysaccharide biosynthesis polyprenyl glycosylphosphotransferase [Blautia sp.]
SDAFLFVASFFWFHSFFKVRYNRYLIGLLLQFLAIGIVIFICNRCYAKYDSPRRIIVIYGTEAYHDLLKKLNAFKYRYKVMGCYSQDDSWDKLKMAMDSCVDVYLYEVNHRIHDKVLRYCDEIGRDIHVSLNIDDILSMGLDLSHSLDTPFVRTRKTSVIWYFPYVKRLFDIVFSLVILVVLSPLMLIIALAIKLYDHGPVFYKQTRLTKGGKEFSIYKFRSMIENAEQQGGAQLAGKTDDRITPVGKIIRMLRLDELPQMLNILKGDMSVVGPRPERPELAREYEKELPEFALRLRVKAGLTGYAQVYGKYNTSPYDKLKMDLIYIEKRSVTVDLKIIFYTVKIMFVPESSEGVEK